MSVGGDRKDGASWENVLGAGGPAGSGGRGALGTKTTAEEWPDPGLGSGPIGGLVGRCVVVWRGIRVAVLFRGGAFLDRKSADEQVATGTMSCVIRF
jgi:hypothetical protein